MQGVGGSSPLVFTRSRASTRKRVAGGSSFFRLSFSQINFSANALNMRLGAEHAPGLFCLFKALKPAFYAFSVQGIFKSLSSRKSLQKPVTTYLTIDRKNFLFANTPSGATGSAVMFSLIMTALENKLDPWRYLTWLMKNSETVKDVEELLPWNAPDACKI